MLNTDNQKSQIKNCSLFAGMILVAGFVIRIFNISAFAIHNDAGHYAFRALGWFDYITSKNQTTPIQWFGEIPWWGGLSFHDAPPLVFFIQKIFFSVFGTVFSLCVCRV